MLQMRRSSLMMKVDLLIEAKQRKDKHLITPQPSLSE
jgi:hypothetical protein